MCARTRLLHTSRVPQTAYCQQVHRAGTTANVRSRNACRRESVPSCMHISLTQAGSKQALPKTAAYLPARDNQTGALVDAVDAETVSEVAWLSCAGYQAVSILVTQGAKLPERMGFWREGNCYKEDALVGAVEPIAAEVLELERLAGAGRSIRHCASLDRQCHTYLVTEGTDTRNAFTRVFTRCACCLYRPWQG